MDRYNTNTSRRELLEALLSQSRRPGGTSLQQQLQDQQDRYINALAAASFCENFANPSLPSGSQASNPFNPSMDFSPYSLDNQNSGSPSFGDMQPPAPPGLPPQVGIRTESSLAAAGVRRPSLGRRRKNLTEKEKFVVFVKIFLKYLDSSGDPYLPPRAKAIVSECTRRNRMGDANYSPLQPAVERRLRRSVGELHWTRAKQHYERYCERRGLQSNRHPSLASV